jgi:dihydroxyacid dehydratase/phosphogluconate dehydratase
MIPSQSTIHSPKWLTSHIVNHSGKYVMEDLHTVGGIPAVLKYLLENGMIHGDCMTVTGKTMAENLAELPGLKEGQDIIRPLSNPVKETGHLTILKGNLAPEVCSIKNYEQSLRSLD